VKLFGDLFRSHYIISDLKIQILFFILQRHNRRATICTIRIIKGRKIQVSQTVTLQLPDNVYYHAKCSAEATQKAIEEVLIKQLSTAVPPLVDEMTSPFKEELRKLERMSDDKLIKLTKKELSIAQQKKYAHLLRQNNQGIITPKEEQELETLQIEADRLMLKQAYAYNLLRWRGYSIPSQKRTKRNGW